METMEHEVADSTSMIEVENPGLITLREFEELGRDERQKRLLLSSVQSGVNGPEDLKRRVIDFVHLRTLLGTASKLSTLSRRFSRLAKRHGVDLAVSVLTADELTSRDFGGRTVVYSKFGANELGRRWRTEFDGSPEALPDYIEGQRARFWNGAE